MKQSTIKFALNVLDAQLANVLSCKTKEQRAYYDGIKLMFNILVSDGYETMTYAGYDDNGKHRITNE